MTALKILGQVHGFDVEIILEDLEMDADVSLIVKGFQAKGLIPRPRYQKDNAPFEPFKGIVESTEIGGKTKKGDKDYFIAQVRPIVPEGSEPKPLYAVKYFDKRSAFREGDRVKVIKGESGYIEINQDDDVPF